MGLFGNKTRTEALKEQIAQHLGRGELLQMLVRDIHKALQTQEYGWIGSSTGYYDTNKRSVVVTTDGILMFNCPLARITNMDEAVKRANRAVAWATLSERSMERAKKRQEEAEEAIDALSNRESVCFRYTDYGFTPLPGYSDPECRDVLDRSKVLRIWAETLMDTMEQIYSDFCFSQTIQAVDLASSGMEAVAFSYEVPSLHWKSWF